MSNRTADPQYRKRVYKLVKRIPRGRVMTYGQIAELLGEGYTARTVGFVMHNSDDETPWHRVINARGGCSTGRIVIPFDKQQKMLESEGVVFDRTGCCDLQTFLWIPGRLRAETKSGPETLFKRRHSPKGKKR